ncbi:hypothetical protein [Sulfurimonas sp.]
MKESQVKLLEYLARFKYLTVSQMHKLNVLKNRSGIYQIIKPLKDKKNNLIDLKNFGVAPVHGKLESFYFLTKQGVDVLVNDLYYEDDVKYTVGTTTLFSRDYFHRKFTIEFHINLYQFIKENDNAELVFADYYFDKLGSNRVKGNLRAKNHIPIEQTGGYIIPDMIFKFSLDNRDYLFLFEQHNGKDTKKLIRQLESYLLILETGAASIKYQFDKSIRVIIVFEYESIKSALIKRLKNTKEFSTFHNFFILKTNEEIDNDFFNNWSLINGEKTNFIS